MKKFACTALSALMLCSLGVTMAACTDNGDGLDENGNVARITMWVGGSEWSGQNLQNLTAFINAYNEVKPDGFEVNLVRKDDLEKAFQTSRTSGSQPDLMLWDRFNTATNCIKGYLYPVNDLIERDSIDTELFYAPAMQEMLYDGQIYGLPVDVDVWGTYVNMDFVEQYDAKQTSESAKIAPRLTANWTWNDLLESAKALKTVAEAGYSAGDQEQHIFKYYVSTGHGDEFLVPDTESGVKGKYLTNFDNEWTRSILEFFTQVKEADVGGKQEDDSFTSAILAMVNKPLYYNNSIKLSDLKNYKFLPQAKPDTAEGVNGGMVGGYGIAYPAPLEKNQTKAWHARHEAAWKFTKWLCTEKENMLKWSEDIGSLPALNEALNSSECVEGNQVLADARTYVTATKTDGSLVYTTRPQVPNFPTLQTDVINSQVPRYLSKQISLDDCISNMTSSGNQKLALGLK